MSPVQKHLPLVVLLLIGCSIRQEGSRSTSPILVGTAASSQARVNLDAKRELKHARLQSPINRAILMTAYANSEHAKNVAAELLRRYPPSSALASQAAVATQTEWAIALAFPMDAGRSSWLRLLSKDAKPSLALAARTALQMRGDASGLPSGSPRYPSEWAMVRADWAAIVAAPNPLTISAYVDFANDASNHAHLRTQAALAAASLGDIGVIGLLSRRLLQEPVDLYSDDTDPEGILRATDNEREETAHAIGDLCDLAPADRETILARSESALMTWTASARIPRDEGITALGRCGSRNALPLLRDWAFRDIAVLEGGDTTEVRAASASSLKALAFLKDESSLNRMLDELKRLVSETLPNRPESESIKVERRYSEKRALDILSAFFATHRTEYADALLELVRPEASKPLSVVCHVALSLASDKQALVWVDESLAALRSSDAKGSNRGHAECVEAGLAAHPVNTPKVWAALGETSPTVFTYASSLGLANITEDQAQSILSNVSTEPRVRAAQALIGMLGGSSEVAQHALRLDSDYMLRSSLLAQAWNEAIGTAWLAAVPQSTLLRLVRNSVATGRYLTLNRQYPWPVYTLAAHLRYGFGPMRGNAVLRSNMLRQAKTGDSEARLSAVWTLALMGERGAIASLFKVNTGNPSQDASLHDLLRAPLRFVERDELSE